MNKKQKSAKDQMLNFLNEQLWYTQSIAKEIGMTIPSGDFQPSPVENSLTQKYWLLWDIKNFVEREIEDDKS